MQCRLPAEHPELVNHFRNQNDSKIDDGYDSKGNLCYLGNLEEEDADNINKIMFMESVLVEAAMDEESAVSDAEVVEKEPVSEGMIGTIGSWMEEDFMKLKQK